MSSSGDSNAVATAAPGTASRSSGSLCDFEVRCAARPTLYACVSICVPGTRRCHVGHSLVPYHPFFGLPAR
jgi:hypothetical protein